MLNPIQQAQDKLIQAGVEPGERVAVICGPCAELVVMTLACWEIGAVIVPVSTRYPQAKVDSVLESVDCSRVLRVENNVAGGLPMTPLRFGELNLDINADASIIFTSGSSGEPKGVLHTIGNHYYSALGSHENIPFGEGDGWLASLAMYHVSGFSLIMRSLIAGGAIAFPEQGESLGDSIMRSEVTHLSVVPTQLMRLLDDDRCVERLRQMKAILVGGAAVPSRLIDRSLELELPVCTTYGSTEAASQIATGTPGVKGNVKVLPYREVKIADDGEILVKGKTLFKGYVKSGQIDVAGDEEGWFYTGDTGSLDENNQLFVTGRKDLMFISGGENIHPEEIERALNNIANIEQAIVVPVDDEEFGQRPVAFIKTKGNLPIDTEEIKTTLSESLEPFKIPKTILPWPESIPLHKPARQGFQSWANRP